MQDSVPKPPDDGAATAAPHESPPSQRPRVTIYGSPFHRIAYKADGRRVVRSFRTYAAARKEADKQAEALHSGNHAGAVLPKHAALAYTAAMRKLDDLAREPQQFEWLRNRVESMHKVFGRIVKNLKVEG